MNDVATQTAQFGSHQPVQQQAPLVAMEQTQVPTSGAFASDDYACDCVALVGLNKPVRESTSAYLMGRSRTLRSNNNSGSACETVHDWP